MLWSDTASGFRSYLLSTGHAESTTFHYCHALSKFWRWCARYESSPCDVDRETVRAWISERLLQVSNTRVHNDLAALRCFYAWLREERYRDDDPTENVRIKRTRSLPTEPLSPAEFDQLVAACNDERDRLMLLVLGAAGLRISELANMEAEHINWGRGSIKVQGKGDKERYVYPNAEVMGRLHAFCGMFPTGPIWLAKRTKKPLSAQQMRKIIYDIAERARLKGVHPHRLRSYFATEYIEEFKDIQALQGVMGHSSPETTARYSQSTRERRGMEQTRRFNPVGRKAG